MVCLTADRVGVLWILPNILMSLKNFNLCVLAIEAIAVDKRINHPI